MAMAQKQMRQAEDPLYSNQIANGDRSDDKELED